MKAKNSPVQRWFALMLVIVNIGFNYFANSFSPEGQSIREVSDQYSNFFMPAPYAFAIWGLIYLAVVVYGVVQVLPGQKNEKAYQDLSYPLSFISILSMCWLLSFTNEMILLSEVIIVVMLITSVYALVLAKHYTAVKELGRWAVVPFSLYAGWLSVATIANTSAWLVSEGYEGGSIGPETWAIAMVVVAVLLGIIESFRFRDIIYPAVIAWGIIAIWASWHTTRNVATAALVGGIVLAVVSGINILRNDATVKGSHIKRSNM